MNFSHSNFWFLVLLLGFSQFCVLAQEHSPLSKERAESNSAVPIEKTIAQNKASLEELLKDRNSTQIFCEDQLIDSEQKLRKIEAAFELLALEQETTTNPYLIDALDTFFLKIEISSIGSKSENSLGEIIKPKRNIRGIQPLPQEESFSLEVKKALEDLNSLCSQNKKRGNPKGKKPRRVVAPPLGILNSEPTPPAELTPQDKPEVTPQAELKKDFGSDNPFPPGSINNVLDPIQFGSNPLGGESQNSEQIRLFNAQ